MYKTFTPDTQQHQQQPPSYKKHINDTVPLTSLYYLNSFDINVIEFTKYDNRMIFTKNMYCAISYSDFVKKIHKSIKYIYKINNSENNPFSKKENDTQSIEFINSEAPLIRYDNYGDDGNKRDIILIIIVDRLLTIEERVILNDMSNSQLLHIIIFPINVKIYNINKNIIINTDCVKAMEYPYDSEVTKWVKKGMLRICDKQYQTNENKLMCPCFIL